MKRFFFAVSAFPFIMLSFLLCDTSTPPEDNIPVNGKIQLVSPAGGETFKKGDVVNVSVKVNGNSVSGIFPYLSIDSGRSFNNSILSQQISIAQGYQRINFKWTIGKETTAITVPWKDTLRGCQLKIVDYNNQEVSDKSSNFTVITP